MVLSRLSSAIQKVRRRSWSERGLFLTATATTAGMWAALRLVPFHRLVEWTTIPTDAPLPNDALPVRRIVWAVGAASRRLFSDRPCLPTALAARSLLARRGVATELRIGVTREGSGIEAHAWLERHGEVLIGGRDAAAQYRPLSSPSVSSTH